jgi:hypothetical protein
VISRLALLTLAGLASTPVRGSMLPEALGEFIRGQLSAVRVSATDGEVLAEYGLRASERAEFTNLDRRTFVVEAFQFGDSEGGHAAYLWLRPLRAARSPLGGTTSDSGGVWGDTYAAVGGAVTVVEKKNYVFRFRGGAPDESALNRLFNGLKDFDPTEPAPDECCAYFVEGSDCVLLGPASLAKLVPRIPPSAVGFHLGAKGRIAQFETPSGPLILTVFEYPSSNAALDQATRLGKISGAPVKVEGRSVGVILDPRDRQDAEKLLGAIDRIPDGAAVGWDPRSVSDAPLTLEGGIGAMLVGALVGIIFAVPRYLVRWHNGIPEVPLGLRI